MRHRKQSDRTTLARAGVLGATIIAAGILGAGTAAAQGGDQDVIDADVNDTVDVDYIEDVGVLDLDYLQVEDTIDGIGTTITG